MSVRHPSPLQWTPMTAASLVAVAVAAVAIAGARSQPTSWNDSSRVATVESLVDRRTLAIDDSPFARDIGDKVFINGAFYSHKPPVPAVLMAGVYQAMQWVTGLKASDQPEAFYRWITIGSSGMAYAIAVWCVFQLGRPLRLPLPMRVFMAASIALATLALPYSRAVNDSILGLAVAAALWLILARKNPDASSRLWSPWQLIGCGTLAGLAYTIDVACGLPLLVSVLALIAYRSRSLASAAIFLAASVPWVTLHHGINYSIGGSLRPIAMVPEYFQWPGSPFTDPSQLTGAWNHDSVGAFVVYAFGLLLGQVGFVLFNLPLLLALVGFVVLVRRNIPERPEIVSAGAWAMGTWLAYAALSTNYAGGALSIRWFVPLLAAGFFVLCVFLRDHREYRVDFVVLTGWGVVWMLRVWDRGPWIFPPVSISLPLLLVALLSWLICRVAAGRLHGLAWKP